MGAFFVYEPQTITFTDENTITITHNFGRKINYQVFVENKPVEPEYTYIDDNSFKLEFFEKGSLVNKSGYIVVG